MAPRDNIREKEPSWPGEILADYHFVAKRLSTPSGKLDTQGRLEWRQRFRYKYALHRPMMLSNGRL